MRANAADHQSVDTQVRRLRAAGAHRVFREVANGARADRPRLRHAIAQLEEGDLLMVMRLDRLARSTRDLLNTLAAIAEKGLILVREAGGWTNDFLAGNGLTAGSEVLAATPGLVEPLKRLTAFDPAW